MILGNTILFPYQQLDSKHVLVLCDSLQQQGNFLPNAKRFESVCKLVRLTSFTSFSCPTRCANASK